MKSMRAGLIALTALLALVLAGCGGGSVNTSGSVVGDVAEIVPASAAVLIALETDPDSEQWQQADELLGKFPGRERLLAEVSKGLADEGIDVDDELLPALGPETYLVVLDLETSGLQNGADQAEEAVVLTKPRDEEKLKQLLEESDHDTVTREIDGWTAIAENEETLARFEQPGEKLADADWFGEAQERVDEDALVTFFANGAPIDAALRESAAEGCDVAPERGTLRYAAGTLTAADDGVRMGVAVVSEDAEHDLGGGESLLSEVPSGAYAYFGSPGFERGRTRPLRAAPLRPRIRRHPRRRERARRPLRGDPRPLRRRARALPAPGRPDSGDHPAARPRGRGEGPRHARQPGREGHGARRR